METGTSHRRPRPRAVDSDSNIRENGLLALRSDDLSIADATEYPMPHRLPDCWHSRQSTVSLFGTRGYSGLKGLSRLSFRQKVLDLERNQR